MPRFTLELADGRRMTLEAADQQTAIAGAQEWERANPMRNATPPAAAPAGMPAPSADYQRLRGQAEANSQVGAHPVRGGLAGLVDRASGYDPQTNLSALDMAVPLPVMDEIRGAGAAIGQGVANIGRAALGRPMVDLGDAYRASKDVEESRRGAYRAKHPVMSTAAEIAGGMGKAATSVAGRTAPALITPAARIAAGAKAVGAGAAIGAGYNAAYQAADAEGGAGERLKAGAEGLLPGAIGGAVAVPLIGGAMALARPAARTAGRLGRQAVDLAKKPFRDPNLPPEIRPSDTAAAEDVVEGILQRSGLTTPQAVRSRAVNRFANDPGATAAELTGRNGVGLVTSLNRRPGQSADLWESALEARAASNPQHAMDMTETHLGVDPRAAAGSMEQLVDQGRKAAEPMYAEAYAAGPLDPRLKTAPELPTLEDLLRRPDIAESMRAAERLARMDGRDPRALGLSIMDAERPAGLASDPFSVGAKPTQADPMGIAKPEGAEQFAEVLRIKGLPARTRSVAAGMDPTEAELLQALRTGEAGRIRQGPSLMQSIAADRGLAPTGELSAMDVDRWHVGKPFQARAIREGGMSVEDHAPLWAHERGFFPELGETPPTREQFLDAVRRELAGQPRYAAAARDPARVQRIQQLDDLEQALARQGLDPRTASDDEIARAFADARGFEDEFARHTAEPMHEPSPGPAPEWRGRSEPVPEDQWTAETWDYVKRAHDGLINTRYTDRATGKLIDTDEARSAVHNSKLLRDQLDKLNPKYGEARAVSVDYKSAQAAFDQAGTWLSHHRGVHDFAKAWEGFSPPMREATRAGTANAIRKMVEAGQLRNGKFSVPAIRQKLEIMFGPEAAGDFVTAMEARSRLNRTGSRMVPGVNSTTAEAEGFGRGHDGEGIKVLEPALRQLMAGKPLAAAGTAVSGALFKALALARTTGLPQQVRDETGRLLLMDADQLQAFIVRRAQQRGAATLDRRRLPVLPAGVAGGAAPAEQRQAR